MKVCPKCDGNSTKLDFMKNMTSVWCSICDSTGYVTEGVEYKPLDNIELRNGEIWKNGIHIGFLSEHKDDDTLLDSGYTELRPLPAAEVTPKMHATPLPPKEVTESHKYLKRGRPAAEK